MNQSVSISILAKNVMLISPLDWIFLMSRTLITFHEDACLNQMLPFNVVCHGSKRASWATHLEIWMWLSESLSPALFSLANPSRSGKPRRRCIVIDGGIPRISTIRSLEELLSVVPADIDGVSQKQKRGRGQRTTHLERKEATEKKTKRDRTTILTKGNGCANVIPFHYPS